jgi:hypothetical protein
MLISETGNGNLFSNWLKKVALGLHNVYPYSIIRAMLSLRIRISGRPSENMNDRN